MSPQGLTRRLTHSSGDSGQGSLPDSDSEMALLDRMIEAAGHGTLQVGGSRQCSLRPGSLGDGPNNIRHAFSPEEELMSIVQKQIFTI